MKIAIVTAVWKRPEVFQLFSKGIQDLKKSFPHIKFDVVVAGSEGAESHRMVQDKGYYYIEIPNDPLSDKHNSTLKKAKELSPDYVLCMGSDDIISSELFSIYLEEIDKKREIIGLKDFYFYNIKNGKAIYWAGYNDSRQGLWCGAGVMIHSKILDMWGWKIWNKAHDKILDNSLHDRVRMTVAKKSTICIKDRGVLAVDLKGDINMTPFELWPNSVAIPANDIRQQFPYLPLGNDISEKAIVDPSVKMGDGNVIMEGAIIRAGVTLGDKNYIGPYCIIGDNPEKVGWWDKPAGVDIGSNNRFTKQVTIDSGTERKTVVGDNVIMLKNAHQGHDAMVKDNTILSCNSVVGGWTEVGENCNLGLGAVVHQRLVVPDGVMIGMNSTVTKKTELKPYRKYAGSPAKDIGSNIKAVLD